MSRLIARILLSVLIFPSAVLLLVISFIFIERWSDFRNEGAVKMACALTAGYMVLYWWLIWFRSVKWTASRNWLSVACAMVAAVVSILTGWALHHAMRYDDAIAFCIATLLTPILWIMGTIYVWHETDTERAARLRRAGADVLACPTCGYNMTGLRESRCPECGIEYTLNELFAGQPSRETGEVEAA
jgi:hypothetical protein